MKEIKQELQYEEVDLDYQEPMATCVYGPAGAGKTRFGIGMPGTIGVVPLNRKTMQTATSAAREFGKTLIKPSFDLIRSSNPMKAARLIPQCTKTIYIDIEGEQPWCCAVHNGRWACDRAKQATLDLYANHKVDSLLIDGFDVLCEDMMISHWGRAERIMPKDRGPYNKEMIEFLNALKGKHFTLTTGWKQVWKNDKPTNDYDWAGWNGLNYHTNVICQMNLQEHYDPDKHDWKFGLTVDMCQPNAELIGVAGENLLTDDSISFKNLALYVYPETGETPEIWD